MREIKFRTYVKGKGMMGPYEIGSKYSENYGYTDEEMGYYLMQFTGLKDKNGKDIFEGDVCIKHQSYRGVLCPHSRGYFKVGELLLQSWSKIEYLAQNLGWPDGNISPEYEVIGNIYENHELLKPA